MIGGPHQIEIKYLAVGPTRTLLPIPVCSFPRTTKELTHRARATRDEQLMLAAELYQKVELQQLQPSPIPNAPSTVVLSIQWPDGEIRDKPRLMYQKEIDNFVLSLQS